MDPYISSYECGPLCDVSKISLYENRINNNENNQICLPLLQKEWSFAGWLTVEVEIFEVSHVSKDHSSSIFSSFYYTFFQGKEKFCVFLKVKTWL